MILIPVLPVNGGCKSAVLHRGPESLRCGDNELVLAVRLGGGCLSHHSAVEWVAVRSLVQWQVSGVWTGECNWGRIGIKRSISSLLLLQYQVWREFSHETNHYVTSKLRIYHVQTKRYRIIWYIHYSDWSEQNIPRSVAPFLGELLANVVWWRDEVNKPPPSFRLPGRTEFGANGLGGWDPSWPQHKSSCINSLQWDRRRTIRSGFGGGFAAVHVGPQSGLGHSSSGGSIETSAGQYCPFAGAVQVHLFPADSLPEADATYLRRRSYLTESIIGTRWFVPRKGFRPIG